MDFATIVGLIATCGIVLWSVMLGGDITLFIDKPSIILIFGGTTGIIITCYPLSDTMNFISVVRKAFFVKDIGLTALVEKLVSFATIARREGILALESQAADTGDEFLTKSVQLAIDGTAPELIKDILTTELAFIEDRHSLGQSILLTISTLSPAMGMIGTLIGLVQMLANMDDPSAIGPGMAVAILTTLYGAMIANIFCVPLAGKLKIRTSNELLAKELIIEGILSIQSGDNPRIVEQKLKAFIPPALRSRIGTGK